MNVRVPEICIMEAFTAIDRKRSEHNSLRSRVEVRIKELRRCVSSSIAANAANGLEVARVALNAVSSDMLTRRDDVMVRLAAGATIFPIDTGWFSDPERQNVIAATRDSLIADAVVRDAMRVGTKSVFYSEDTADFDTPEAHGLFRTAGVKMVHDANVVLAYAEGKKTWESIP